MSDEIIRDVPAHYLVFLFINGFFVLLLSPVYLLLLTWMPWINPFAQVLPSEAVASIALIVIFSFIIGIPGFLLRNWLSITRHLGFSFDEIQNSKNCGLIEWKLKAKNLEKYRDFLFIKFQIVQGVIVGSEIALIVNTGYIVNYMMHSGTIQQSLISITSISLASLIISVAYDTILFRKNYYTEIVAIQDKADSLIKKQKKHKIKLRNNNSTLLKPISKEILLCLKAGYCQHNGLRTQQKISAVLENSPSITFDKFAY